MISELRVVALLAGGEAVWGLADRGGVLVRFSSLAPSFFFLLSLTSKVEIYEVDCESSTTGEPFVCSLCEREVGLG